MKKLEKLTLGELKNEVPTLGKREAIRLKGGLSPQEMYNMVDAGTWGGGFVDGWGYVSGVFDASAYDVQGHMGDNDQGFIGSASGQTYEECYWETFTTAVTGIAGMAATIILTAVDGLIPVDLGLSVFTPDPRADNYNGSYLNQKY